jgi:indole-3-glycerol phosphate synthase
VINILQKILDARLARLAVEKQAAPIETLERQARQRGPARDFAGAFPLPGIHIIAEVKRASPSRGTLSEDMDPARLAAAYEKGGAAAISVITEQDHFRGSMATLGQVRETVALPILRKDFIIDPYQIVESRATGADSFLLIGALLNPDSLESLIGIGRSWGMEPLVEVHDLPELEAALEASATVIGINNRDLKTFGVDLNTTLELAAHVPDDRIIVSESGINDNGQILRLAAAGVRGFLVGESLVTSPDPLVKLRELIHGARA